MQITISNGSKAKNLVSLQTPDLRKLFLPTSLSFFFFFFFYKSIPLYRDRGRNRNTYIFLLPQRGFLPLCISLFLTSLPFHVFSTPLPFAYLWPFQGPSFLPPSPSLLRPQCPLSSPPPSLLLSLQFIQLRLLLFSSLPVDRAEFHVLALLSCKTVFFSLCYISKAERKFGTVERAWDLGARDAALALLRIQFIKWGSLHKEHQCFIHSKVLMGGCWLLCK